MSDAKPEWTVETLKELMTQRFVDSDKAVQAALQAAKEAVEKANIASEKRFDGVNEFRGQLTDQAATFIGRLEYTAQYKSLEDKIDAITNRLNVIQGNNDGIIQNRSEGNQKTNTNVNMFTTVFIGLSVLLSGVAVLVSLIK